MSRYGPALLFCLELLVPCAPVHAQMTSSRSVAVLPLVASSSDSALAAVLDQRLIETITPALQRRGLQLELVGQDRTPRQIARLITQPMDLQKFTRSHEAAFLIGGGLHRLPEGDLLATLILFCLDERKIIASEWQTFSTTEEAVAGIREMADQIARPRTLTPTDTPIFYSMVVPGMGQLMVEQPVHAIACAGLFTAAWFSHREIDTRVHPAYLARQKKELKRKRIFLIVTTWLFNVADTMALCRWRSQQVDTTVFFSIMESLRPDVSMGLPSGFSMNVRRSSTPGLAVRIVFR